MNNIYLVGSTANCNKYIENYIFENNFSPFEIEYFNDIIKIEDARNLKKSLGYKVKTKKLFVFVKDITIEAQNSLLKNIEEAGENIYFIFCAGKESALLPTVKSRCRQIMVGEINEVDSQLQSLIEEVFSSNYSWADIDNLINYVDNKNVETLLPAIRSLLLKNLENESVSKYFFLSKKLLPMMLLANTNNVNQKIVIESVFM